jgi:hypothetical protein
MSNYPTIRLEGDNTISVEYGGEILVLGGIDILEAVTILSREDGRERVVQASAPSAVHQLVAGQVSGMQLPVRSRNAYACIRSALAPNWSLSRRTADGHKQPLDAGS